MALSNVGGSIEMLEKVLDDVAYSDSNSFNSGPKQAAFKDIVKRLMAYERYCYFSDILFLTKLAYFVYMFNYCIKQF